ncbi:MAG: transcriptional repressor [Clostridia bacterium]|nr:transcriptional repressor [Clostridia bacterium]
MKNYSRQREAVSKVLKASKSHPSAAAIYDEVKKIVPSISLGTVYRNLDNLKQNGDIISVSVGDGTERYDGDISPHIHLICRNCKNIIDIHIKEDFGKKFATECGFSPDSSVYTVYGLCNNCAQK